MMQTTLLPRFYILLKREILHSQRPISLRRKKKDIIESGIRKRMTIAAVIQIKMTKENATYI
jgi:hypothetical protein